MLFGLILFLSSYWHDLISFDFLFCSVAKIDIHLETILKTKTQFQEDRRNPHKSFNEQQIHKFEK